MTSNYIKPNNFRTGAKVGAYLYIGATIASLCITPFVFTYVPYVILPFALLISHPIAWLLLGAVFTATFGLLFSIIKPLFNLAKDFLHKRENKSKGYVALKELNGEFHENLQTLVHQTNRENYSYWLRQADIAHIARVVYGYSEDLSSDQFFCIPGDVNSLNEGLKNYKNKVEQENSKTIFTSIINTGNHWVTLVVSYSSSDGKYMAYYCDSFGKALPNASDKQKDISLANKITEQQIKPATDRTAELIGEAERDPGNAGIEEEKESMKEALRCVRKDKNELVSKQINVYYISAVLKETLEMDDSRSSQTKQQNDGYNCGIFSLLNAKKITDMIKEGKSGEEIINSLEHTTPEELIEQRKSFSTALMKDEQWRKDLEYGLLCDLSPKSSINNSDCTSSFTTLNV